MNTATRLGARFHVRSTRPYRRVSMVYFLSISIILIHKTSSNAVLFHSL